MKTYIDDSLSYDATVAESVPINPGYVVIVDAFLLQRKGGGRETRVKAN